MLWSVNQFSQVRKKHEETSQWWLIGTQQPSSQCVQVLKIGLTNAIVVGGFVNIHWKGDCLSLITCLLLTRNLPLVGGRGNLRIVSWHVFTQILTKWVKWIKDLNRISVKVDFTKTGILIILQIIIGITNSEKKLIQLIILMLTVFI